MIDYNKLAKEKGTAKSEQIFKDIENSLADLQYFLNKECNCEGDMKVDSICRKEWLAKRIEYLEKNPEKQEHRGVYSMDEIVKEKKRVRSSQERHESVYNNIKQYNKEIYGL